MSNLTLKGIFEKDSVKQKITEMVGKNSTGFISSVLQIATNNALLAKADPMSIYNCAMMSAALNLSINQNLGHAYIIPYNENKQDENGQWQKVCVAQFQVGWKGIVQLALRSGQYKAINVIEVYENQFKSFNSLTEELDADFSIDGEGEIIGYVAYLSLLNGFEKTSYWSKAKVEKHGAKFSKTYNNPKGVWKQDFDSMAKKTVLKNTISKWGVLSIEMQKAIEVDQAVIKDPETMDVDYVDAGGEVVKVKDAVPDSELPAFVEAIKAGNTTLEDLDAEYALTFEQSKALADVKIED